MTDMLESNSAPGPETAHGGFSVPKPTACGERDPYANIRVRQPSSEQIAQARQDLDALLAEDGVDQRLKSGLQDAIASRDSGRRDSPDAQLYARYEGLLGIVNAEQDRLPPLPSVGDVAIRGAAPGVTT